MLRIAVVTHYFPSSAEPWQGRSAYQTLRLIAQRAEVQVFYPNASYPSILKSRSRRFTLDHSWSPSEVKTSYIDCPAGNLSATQRRHSRTRTAATCARIRA